MEVIKTKDNSSNEEMKRLERQVNKKKKSNPFKTLSGGTTVDFDKDIAKHIKKVKDSRPVITLDDLKIIPTPVLHTFVFVLLKYIKMYVDKEEEFKSKEHEEWTKEELIIINKYKMKTGNRSVITQLHNELQDFLFSLK